MNKYFLTWNNKYQQLATSGTGWPLYSRPATQCAIDSNESLSWELKLSEEKLYTGHNYAINSPYTSGTRMFSYVSISPIWAKDLSGRLIYLGYGPDAKDESEWKGGHRLFFPRFSKHVAGDHGVDEVESTFSTSFRTLDMSLDMKAVPSGDPNNQVALRYKHPNLYPYKLRLDTFYGDGWRIPQTEYLYVKSDGITLTETESAAAEFFSKWDSRGNLTYEEWYEKHDGDSWFESLFGKGVTVIPTVEAFNGFHKVSADFELEDFWPGRAVSGLHKVVNMIPSEAPKGTILEVKRPGLAMSRRIEPAQVVVSDGSGYQSPHISDPDPYLPDLRLPHTRSVAEWEACHLPTHPSHFEKPALWGWDKKTGRFMQLSGPLWDPLHYYYKSVDEVVRAFKVPAQDEAGRIPVPAHMKLKFYPIEMMSGYDVIDDKVYERRQQEDINIESAIRRKPLNEISSTLGYHPLPLELEFELDNWWFPELAPKNRLDELAPSPLISRRLLPVIRSNVSPSYYAKEVEDQEWWIKDTENLKIATGRPLEDYPFLIRYLGEETDLSKISEWVTLHLEHVDDDIMQSSAHQLWSEDKPEILDKTVPGFYSALMDMRSKGLDLMRIRHKLYRENLPIYYATFWNMLPVSDLLELLQEIEKGEQVESFAAQQQSNESYLLDQSNLKSSELGGSLDEDGSF